MKITVSIQVKRSPEDCWRLFTGPEHIMHWNQASADWHCPAAESELKAGGQFCYTMAARDGSASFDFTGQFTEVIPEERLCYKITDGRSVQILFSRNGDFTQIEETFDAEDIHSAEMQREGWQAILHNFKHYAELQGTS